ncbi:Glycosyltransferase family 25 (LPS biosynthesis protein) [Ruegeria denitrificans]|uniref:Glycosyltransferase family 25 (LPS biosynthesis protein) n=1 Tax=Ruegeria denitrificans TaxID=1715692 RepID=A0A0P1I6K9_9RHOB|nr:glycosyltransferase family 25 protein [Ruegeria denitrificans]CUJ93426.1 Glycosyltransferase family 25 (LPS biosynthesis protein) [Ruegeria denitrificans]
MGQYELPPGTGVYFINLDRVPERAEFMDDQFTRAGLVGAQRFSAVDGQQPGALDDNSYVAGTGTRWGLTQSEIACFESHRAVWQTVVDQGLKTVAIFEDDVEMSAQAGAVIASLLAVEAGFDLIKLDYSPRSMRFGPLETIADIPMRPMLEMAPSSAAYILTQAACRKLLSWSGSYSDHLDDFISFPRTDWRMYQCFPAMGVQVMWSKQQEQTAEPVKVSERSQDQKTNSGLDKGPLWFRIRRELRAARRKLYWRTGGQGRLLAQGGFAGYIPSADDLNV